MIVLIHHIRGRIEDVSQEYIVIDVNGVGYELIVHSRIFAHINQGEEKKLFYTHLQVLDNEFKLFGFLEIEERKLFRTLLSISGMGSKNALQVLSSMNPQDFYETIFSGDEKKLISIPGIGKKTAQRLIFELKSKFGDKPPAEVITVQGDNINEILEVLEALEYNRSEVYPIIIDLKNRELLDKNIEGNIKTVLKEIAKLKIK